MPEFQRRCQARQIPMGWIGLRYITAALVVVGSYSSAAAREERNSIDAPPAQSARAMESIAGEVFATRCMSCHRFFAEPGYFKKLHPSEIYTALRSGSMQEAAVGLDDGTLRAVANYLGNPKALEARPANGGAKLCSTQDRKDEGSSSAYWPGFSLDVRNNRSVKRSFTTDDTQALKLAWTFTYPDTQYWNGAANPLAIAEGRIFAASVNKWVYALDAQTGCAFWTFEADGRIRSNVAVADGTAVFGDLLGNVYALDSETGKLIWRQKADFQANARITGSLTVHKGRVYVPVSSLQEALTFSPDISCCTFAGSVVSFDLGSGNRVWQTYMIDEPLRHLGKTPNGVNRFGPSGVGVWSVPTVDEKRGLIYVGTGNQYTEPAVEAVDAVVALDMNTGEKRWIQSLAPEETGGVDIWTAACDPSIDPQGAGCSPKHVPGQGGTHAGDRDISAPVMLVRRNEDGREVLVVGSEDGMLYALDPDAKGKVLWKTRVGIGSGIGGIQYGMASDGTLAYAPLVDLDEVGLSQAATAEAKGALAAVDLTTGEIAWRTELPMDGCEGKSDICTNGLTAPPLVLGDVVISGGFDGVLRIFDRVSGNIVWTYDSVRQYQGVNGMPGEGGSFGMGGAVLGDDILYINSGFGFLGLGLPGNVLLAFKLNASR